MVGEVKKIGVLILLIFLLSIVYFNSLENGFHFDDYHHIVDNPHLKNIKNIPSFFLDTTKFSKTGWQNHYRPLLLVTHTINYAIGGLNPIGYHLVNLSFHVGSAFLVFLIVQAMLGRRQQVGSSRKEVIARLPEATEAISKRDCFGTKVPRNDNVCFFAAFSSALIFAVHPFNSEVVNYISARSSVMSGFFYLLAFYCWVRFRNVAAGFSLRDQGGIPRNLKVATTPYYLTSLLAFLLGMLTKEVVITLPVVLWLYDLYFNRPSSGTYGTQAKACGYMPALTCLLNWRTYIPYIPFVLLVAIPYLVLSGPLTKSLIHEGGLPRSYYVNLLTGTKVLMRYVQMLFVPAHLSVDHLVQNVHHFWEWEVIASTGFLSGILVLSLWLYRHGGIVSRIISFFIVWFFVTLLPTTLIPLEAMLQENRGYLAGISFAIIVGMMIWQAAGVAAGVAAGFSLRSKSEVRKYVSIALAAILIAAFSVTTIQRNRVWKDELTLWTDTASKYPMSPRAHFALANFYKRNGDIDIAIELYRRVLELDPDYHEAHNNLGVLYFKEGKIDLAIEEFKNALSSMPAYLNARMGLGKAFMKKGEMEMAEREFEAAIALARVTHQDAVTKEATSYLEWIKKRTILGEIKQ